MAPPRKPSAPDRRHSVFLRLPDDVYERIAAEAKAQARPMNRILINDLARIPYLDAQATLGETVRDMQITLEKQSWHLPSTTINEDLLRAVDAVCEALTEGQRQVQLDRLRTARAAMLEGERRLAQMERERLAAQIKQLERRIAMFTALPASSLENDDLPSLKAELARLQRVEQGAVAEPKGQRAPKRAKEPERV